MIHPLIYQRPKFSELTIALDVNMSGFTPVRTEKDKAVGAVL
jgi:hypothetical protein